MTKPSAVTATLDARLEATCNALVKVAAERTEARRPFNAAIRACPVRFTNLGAATAARIPRIRITTISSIKVKPRVCLVIFISLKKFKSLQLQSYVYFYYTQNIVGASIPMSAACSPGKFPWLGSGVSLSTPAHTLHSSHSGPTRARQYRHLQQSPCLFFQNQVYGVTSSIRTPVKASRLRSGSGSAGANSNRTRNRRR